MFEFDKRMGLSKDIDSTKKTMLVNSVGLVEKGKSIKP